MTTAESFSYTRQASSGSRDQVEDFANDALAHFKKATQRYALFHIAFFTIGIIELFAFVLFFSFLTQSTTFAFSLAGLFFTAFTYFILLFYLQAKKPHQLISVRNSFLASCENALSLDKKSGEFHLALSEALQKLLQILHRQEYSYYAISASFKTLSPLMQKFSAWTHWKDLHQMKEILLFMVVREQIELIKLSPTDLQAHARLANTYSLLGRLYTDPRKIAPDEEHVWVSPEYSSKEMVFRFKRALSHAIEELKILDTLAPSDLWVHAQMALLYRQLDQPDEEMRTYEKLLEISPNDEEVLLRLGVLYFEGGASAKGLRLYEQLKRCGSPKADELIAYYDASIEMLYSEDPLNG